MIVSTHMSGACTVRIHDDYMIRDGAALERSVESLREILRAAAARIDAEGQEGEARLDYTTAAGGARDGAIFRNDIQAH